VIACSLKPNFIFVTETWLTDQITDDCIKLNQYTVLRSDRQSRKGGGVCVFYEDFLNVTQVDLLCKIEEIEMLSFISGKNVFIVLYIPPNLPKIVHELITNEITDKLDNLLQTKPFLKPVICGDLNNYSTKTLCQSFSLKNIICEPTRKKTVLDYFLVPKEDKNEYSSKVREPLGTSDHNIVHVYHQKTQPIKSPTVVYDFRQSYIDLFLSRVQTIKWDKITEMKDVDEMVHTFYVFMNYCSQEIPRKKVYLKSNDAPWITPVIKLLIQKRWVAYKKKDFNQYEHYKAKVKREIVRSKTQWANNIKAKNKNPWKLVNRKSNAPNIDNFVKDNFQSEQHFVDNLNEQLHSVFKAPYTFPAIQFTKEEDHVSEEDVKSFLDGLNGKKAYAKEEFPIRLLKIASNNITKPICHIILTCLISGTFPKRWKLTDVIPIPKSKSISLSNFRPISLRPVLSTILEKQILERIKPHIIPLIDNSQFGFLNKSSTQIALIKLLEDTTRHLEQNDITATSIISFDLKKAFDTVPHHILYNKLKSILPHRFLSLILSYLSERHQRVTTRGHISTSLSVTSGVPQGSIISPILFLLFINDLKSLHENCVIKFADDTSFIVPHYKTTSFDPVIPVINHMEKWCLRNGIELNIKKTQILTVSKSTSIIYNSTSSSQFYHPRTSSIKILGITINEKLTWNEHIDDVYKKCSQRLCIIRKLKPILSEKDLILIYYGFIDSIMSYCSSLFVNLPQYLSLKLDKIHKRAQKIIFDGRTDKDKPVKPSTRRHILAMKLFTKIEQSNHVLHHYLPEKLRFTKKYRTELNRTKRRARQFFPHMVRKVNDNRANRMVL